MDYKVELQNNNIDLNSVLSAINALPKKSSGGSGTFTTQSKTVSPTESQQTVTPDSGYDGLSSVTVNAIPTDYVGSSVTRQESKVITPTKSAQTAVSTNTYVTGTVTVSAIPNEYITTTDATAIASDIANGKTAYVNGAKITGTHTCSGGTGGTDTSDATATAEDIVSGKTAYINGGKVTGTMTVQSYYVSGVEPSTSLGIDGDLCLVRAGE